MSWPATATAATYDSSDDARLSCRAVSAEWLVLNAAYAVYTASALFKEMIWLRLTLLAATVLFIAYGFIAPNTSVLLWNLPVAVLHLYALWKLFSARRGVDLDDEAEALRTLLFPSLDRVSFDALWHCGEERVVTDGVLIRRDEPVPDLFLILDGTVEVVNPDIRVEMSHFRFVGEMSSLNDAAATATVFAPGQVRVRAWNKQRLAALSKSHPETNTAMLKAMGQEVARKLS